jgi:hypothetical protein
MFQIHFTSFFNKYNFLATKFEEYYEELRDIIIMDSTVAIDDPSSSLQDLLSLILLQQLHNQSFATSKKKTSK